MKRRIFRIFVGLLALVLLLLASVQIVLWTDLPRKLVLDAIQKKLQLRVTANEFSTGWMGHTTLTGVRISLPLSEESFLEAGTVRVDHTTLFALLVGRSLSVEAVTIDRPNLLVRQHPDGRWNIAEVAELISRAGGGKQPESLAAEGSAQGATAVPSLPAMRVTQAVVRVIDRAGKQVTLQPLSITGQSDGALVWRYDATIPGTMSIVGKVAPGGQWQHEVDVKLARLGTLFRPFLGDPDTLDTLVLDGAWSGRISGGLAGRLRLNSFAMAGYSASGAVDISTGGRDAARPGDAAAGPEDNLITLVPAGLEIKAPADSSGAPTFPPARAEAGAVRFDGRRISADKIALAFAGGTMRFTGDYTPASGAGTIEGSWKKIRFPSGMAHSGAINALVSQPWPGQPRVEATVTTDGTRAADAWNARATLKGEGDSWQNMTWRVATPTLTFTAGANVDRNEAGVTGANAVASVANPPSSAKAAAAPVTYDLSGLAASLSTRRDLLTLDSLDLPAGMLYGPFRRGTLRGGGQYAINTGQWFAYLTGENWPVGLSPQQSEPANWLLNVYGDARARQLTLKELFLKAGTYQVWARGGVWYGTEGVPAQLHVFSWYPPVQYTWSEENGGDKFDDVRFAGMLRSELHLTRNLYPIDLNIRGSVMARDLSVNGKPLGDADIELTGRADGEGVRVASKQIDLFEAPWKLAASYQWATRTAAVDVRIDGLSLANVDRIISPAPRLRGRLKGNWSFSVPEFDVDRMSVRGEYHVAALARAATPGSPAEIKPAVASATNAPVIANSDGAIQAALTLPAAPPASAPKADAIKQAGPTAPAEILLPIADQIDGQITGESGQIRFHDIRIRHRAPEQGSEGRASAALSFPLRSPRRMKLKFDLNDWPIEITDRQAGQTTSAVVSADTDLNLDLKHFAATGPVSVRATLSLAGKPVGKVSAAADFNRRRIDLKTLSGDILGGPLSGDGIFLLDEPLKSRGRIAFDQIDADRLTHLYPYITGLRGVFSGQIDFFPTDPAGALDPATGKRALPPPGPFAARGHIGVSGGGYRAISMGDIDFTAYLGDRRAILEKLHWNVAGGTLDGWTRLTWYGRDATPFVHTSLKLDQLDVDQLFEAARTPDQPRQARPGRLAGTIIAAANPFTDQGRRQASGEIFFRVTDSDLVNVNFVTALYNLLSLQGGITQPTGRGYLNARIEGNRVEIPGVRYFNRGADLLASLTIDDVFAGPKATLTGNAAASARPLKDLKLPFMADLDKLLSAIQGNVATVAISGQLSNPAVKAIPFAESGGTLRRFFIGEVQGESTATPGR